MNKAEVVASLLHGRSSKPVVESAQAFAPANIALCKYWGKRDVELNLPVNASLSISLGDLGAHTKVSVIPDDQDKVVLNEKEVGEHTVFAKRVRQFLNLFRTPASRHFGVETTSTIPVGAGLASSASGFCALARALNQLFGWDLPPSTISILARLGSGSAARSCWNGFVEWRLGERNDGMDSQGVPLDLMWPELRIGLWILDTHQKPIGSTEAMQHTVNTSPFYSLWATQQHQDLINLKAALFERDFVRMGEIAESNALAMHALMLSARPAVLYSSPQTVASIQKIWEYRRSGLPVYFTQDAGPNVKLLFLQQDEAAVLEAFPGLCVVNPFAMETSHVS